MQNQDGESLYTHCSFLAVSSFSHCPAPFSHSLMVLIHRHIPRHLSIFLKYIPFFHIDLKICIVFLPPYTFHRHTFRAADKITQTHTIYIQSSFTHSTYAREVRGLGSGSGSPAHSFPAAGNRSSSRLCFVQYMYGMVRVSRCFMTQIPFYCCTYQKELGPRCRSPGGRIARTPFHP